MIHRRVTLVPPHGEPIRADLRIPENSFLRSVVVVAHGFKGFKDWGFFPHVAERLAEEGHVAVSINFSRSGIGEDLETFSDLEGFSKNTFSWELGDLLWVLDQVGSGKLFGSVPGRIGLLGHSRGGGSSILAAREYPNVHALVTWASIANFDRWTPEQAVEWRATGTIHVLNGRTGQEMPLDVSLLDDLEENRERLDIVSAAGAVQAPWLVVHGAEDQTVPLADGEKLLDAARRGTGLFIEGSGHTFEATHPFEDVSPGLAKALSGTLEHFDTHLRIKE